MAIFECARMLWEATKPTIVLGDNKSVKRVFRTKAIPPALWNACDYVLQYNFKTAHIAGPVNAAADIISKLELKLAEKIFLKIWEDIPSTLIEVRATSSDIADQKQFFLTRAYKENESEEKTPGRIEQSWHDANEWVANGESPSLRTSVKELTKVQGITTSYSMNEIELNIRIPVEKDVHIILIIRKFKKNWPTTWWSAPKNRQTIQAP